MLRIFLLLLLLALPVASHAEPENSTDAYDRAIAQLDAAKDTYSRWCALGRASKESLNLGRDAQAKAFAGELEKLAPTYPRDWNYGNAIQDFHTVLGRLSLKAGDVEAAKKHLIAAGKSPGSPQMDTFGPNVTLASELLAKGENAAVLEYLELCRNFWKMEEGKLEKWKLDIQAGRVPDFGANLNY